MVIIIIEGKKMPAVIMTEITQYSKGGATITNECQFFLRAYSFCVCVVFILTFLHQSRK